MLDSVFALCRPETEASHAQLSSRVGLSCAQHHLSVTCCLELVKNGALVRKYSRQMMHLQWQRRETFDSSLIQVGHRNVQACAQPQAELSTGPAWAAV